MDIYKYKIWTGHIPGISSVGCAKPSRQITNSGPTLPDDCTPCTNLSMTNKIDACVDCANGAINVCCPNPGESCCGLILSPCDEFYAWSVEEQNRYCSQCPLTGAQQKQLGPLSKKTTPSPQTSTSTEYCECCNRTQRESKDSTLTIFLDHDFNDMGHYTMWDGQMGQEDTFSNFLLTGDTVNPFLVSLNNSTEFGFYKYLEGIEYSVDWGDGTALTLLNAPTITTTHSYMSSGPFTVTVQMRAPWGITSVSHHITIPFQTGDQIWFTVPNQTQTYTFTPPGGGAPVSMDYEGSEFGPLDGGLGVNSYVTASYVATPYTIQGITDSMLSSLQSYSSSSSPGLPPGYNTTAINGIPIGPPTTVNIGGQVQLPNGTYVENLWGTIDNVDNSVPGDGFTGYTITNGADVYTLVDHENGVTVFSTTGSGLEQEDFLTRECGMALQGACDLCEGTQYYFLGGYGTQVVHTDRGEWDDNESYDPGDYVSYDGCCFYAISILDDTIPAPNRYDVNSPHWRLCFGSCTEIEVLPSRYNCIQGLCLEILPTSGAYYDNATYVGTPPTTANALADCTIGCLPPVGVEIQWMCEIQGTCSPIPPSHNYYNAGTGPNGETIYGGPTGYVDCTTNCTNTTIGYDCVPDPAPATTSTCQPVVGGGFYGDLPTCQATCGGTHQLFDWWCVNLICTALSVGTSQPPGANHSTPYTNATECVENCGSVLSWQCVCDMYAANTIVDLSANYGAGSFGGQRCMAVLDSTDPNAYTDKVDCEQNCLSWGCDSGSGICVQTDATTGPPNTNYCSDVILVNGAVQTDSGGVITTFDAIGCNDECHVPTVHVCIGGTCTPVTVNDTASGQINPDNKLYLGSPGNPYHWYVGTDITWNNAEDWSCNDYSIEACQDPLSNNWQTTGCGCTTCTSLESLNNTDYPVELYNPNDFYEHFDVVIGAVAAVSQATDQYKYWYDPRPVCDNTTTNAPTGLPWPLNEIDCSDPGVLAECEDPNMNQAQPGAPFPYTNPGQGTHPCTLLNCLVPQYNATPPTLPTVPRTDVPHSCWRPCGTP